MGNRYHNARYPDYSWKSIHRNVPSWMNRIWWKKHRASIRKALANCKDWDELTLRPESRVGNIYDWV